MYYKKFIKILRYEKWKDSGLVVSWSLVKKIGESLGLVKLRLARKLQSLVNSYWKIQITMRKLFENAFYAMVF